MKSKVVLIATGGTIASRHDAALGRAVATTGAEDLIAGVPGLAEAADLEIDDFATVPSFDMSVAFAVRLAERIGRTLARPEVAGAVVTHGTDTMEETAYLADLLVQSDKPTVFTGAQRTHDDPDPDGPRNIVNSVRVAASPAAVGLGAMVCFNDRIHAARDVTKVHASAVDTFQAIEQGALGAVDGVRVSIDRRPIRRRTFAITELVDRVELIRLALGLDARAVDRAVAAGAAGLVIEAFGRGNGPTGLSDAIRRATAAGRPVVVTSRCPAGRVEPIYGGGGGGRDLADAGAIFAGDLKGPKARLLLVVALSNSDTRDRVAAIFREMAP